MSLMINIDKKSNSFFDLDTKWINDVQVNLSAVERRTSSFPKRRTVKKEYQVAWLLNAITLLDLTTLSGDDTFGKVSKLCQKGLSPVSNIILKELEIKNKSLKVGAICVYHDLVSHAKNFLQNKLPVAVVSTGFPAGLSSIQTRKKEIVNSINNGADEVDIVINRSHVLRNDWKRLYDEVREFKELTKGRKMKAILGVGDLATLRKVAKASLVCMMAGADFIKTSTGKEKINANLNNSLVMLRMIREFYDYTGKKIGFKPAGGISSAKDVLNYLMLVYEELGKDWISSKLFRVGASSLLIDIERQLYHYALGRYATANKMAIS